MTNTPSRHVGLIKASRSIDPSVRFARTVGGTAQTEQGLNRDHQDPSTAGAKRPAGVHRWRHRSRHPGFAGGPPSLQPATMALPPTGFGTQLPPTSTTVRPGHQGPSRRRWQTLKRNHRLDDQQGCRSDPPPPDAPSGSRRRNRTDTSTIVSRITGPSARGLGPGVALNGWCRCRAETEIARPPSRRPRPPHSVGLSRTNRPEPLSRCGKAFVKSPAEAPGPPSRSESPDTPDGPLAPRSRHGFGVPGNRGGPGAAGNSIAILEAFQGGSRAIRSQLRERSLPAPGGVPAHQAEPDGLHHFRTPANRLFAATLSDAFCWWGTLGPDSNRLSGTPPGVPVVNGIRCCGRRSRSAPPFGGRSAFFRIHKIFGRHHRRTRTSFAYRLRL